MHDKSKRRLGGSLTRKIPVLTIAGSDCSGGAGLEADLKTFAAHGVYGMATVTCVVAETPRNVVSIQASSVAIVRQQIACCLEGMKRVVIKTGMLYSTEIIRATALELERQRANIAGVIVDPVMVATSGSPLLKANAIQALRELIGSQANLLTPNLDEAEILCRQKIRTENEMEAAARALSKEFTCALLMKGGHLPDQRWAKDFFWNGSRGFWVRSRRIRNVRTHGTGCTYSAALAANLALGHGMDVSVRRAKKFITRAIARTQRFGPWMALGHNEVSSRATSLVLREVVGPGRGLDFLP